MTETLYELLGVPPDASEAEIRTACRRAARRYSPDYNPSPDAHEQMVRVNEARATLLDARKRRTYDISVGVTATNEATAAARTLRVVPSVTVVGEMVVGERRLLKVSIYMEGPEPETVTITPELGDGWWVEEATFPSRSSGPYLTVTIALQVPDGDRAGLHSESVDVSFDDDLIRAFFTWQVVREAPPSPPPPMSSAPPQGPSSAMSAPRSVPPSSAPSMAATTPSSAGAPAGTAQTSVAMPAGTSGPVAPAPVSYPDNLDDISPVARFFLLFVGSLILWGATPVIASLASHFVPGLTSAVFMAGEDTLGRGRPPLTLYQHLAGTIAVFDLAVIVLSAALGVRLRVVWPITLSVVIGLAMFVWLVGSEGGELWQWDVLPATVLLGYLVAQLLSRLGRFGTTL